MHSGHFFHDVFYKLKVTSISFITALMNETEAEYDNIPCYNKTDKQYWATSVDQNQTPQKAASDQGLHWLTFVQQFLDTSTGSKMIC